MTELNIKKEGHIMRNQSLKTRYPSFYKPVFKEEGNSDSYFGIVGFDADGCQKCIMRNLICDCKLLLNIAKLLNANGVAMVHAEDIIYDILYEEAPSFSENILQKTHS